MGVVRTNEVEMIETPRGVKVGILAAPARGAREVLVLRQQQEPGGQNVLHSHDREEVMIQLAGTVTMTVADEPIEVTAGDSLIVAAHTVHHVTNTGDTVAEWLLAAPGGMRVFNHSGEDITPPFIV